MSLLKEYLSQEAHHEAAEQENNVDPNEVRVEVEIPEVQPVSEDEVYEADEHLDEVSQERAEFESQVASYQQMTDEVNERLASLESFEEILQHGLENQQYSPQFAAAVSQELAVYQSLFGDEMSAPSLEDHGHDQLEAYYTTSLEGIKEAASKMKSLVSGAAASLSKTISMMGTNEKAADALIKKADALLDKFEFADSTTVKLGGLAKTFNFNGSVPSDIAKAITTDQGAIGTLIGGYLPACSNYAEKTLGELVKAINTDSTDGPAKAVIGMKVPYDAVPNNVRDGSRLLGSVLAAHHEKSNEAINSARLVDLHDQVTEVYLERTKPKDGGEVTITKAQAQQIAKGVKGYAELLRRLSKDAKKQLQAQEKAFTKQAGKDNHGVTQGASMSPITGVMGYRKHNNIDNSEKNKALNALVRLVRGAAWQAPSFYKDLSNHIESKGKASLALAKRTGKKSGGDKDKDEE